MGESAAPTAIPTLVDRGSGFDACARTRVVCRTPAAEVVAWACLHDGAALRAPRHHSAYVLTVLHRGACEVSAGTWRATLDPVTAVLHAPGVEYRTRHPYGCIDAGFSLALRCDLAEEVLAGSPVARRLAGRPSTVVAAGAGSPGLRQLLEFYERGCGSLDDPLDVEERVMRIYAAVLPPGAPLAAPKRTGTERLHRRVIDRATRYLIENGVRRVQLCDVARHAGASPAHLSRLFKRHKGVSLGEYLLRIRLSAVVDALGRDDRHLERIAHDTGFCSHSHLSTVFRRKLGRTPDQVRRMVSN